MRLLALVLGLAALGVGAARCGPSEQEQQARAIAAARETHEQELEAGRDLSSLPCIADPLPEPNDDWVVVIVEQPRTEEDAASRCSAYASGEAEHFVEMDEFGHLVRAE